MIFPITTRVNAYNHLEIGGCDLVELARLFGTPLYVFDDAHLRTRAQEFREAFQSRWSPSLPLYATKAYFSPYLARLCMKWGLGIEVTSEGELEVARRVGFPRDRIYTHGNNKTASEIRGALAQGVRHVIADNFDEIVLLARLVAELNSPTRVLLRLAPAIDPHTHEYLATGIPRSKFGLSLTTGDALRAARRIAALAPQLDFVGLHIHLGSQISCVEPYREAVGAICDFAVELNRAIGFKLEEVDLGGGWAVAYREEAQPLTPDAVAQAIVDELRARVEQVNPGSVNPLLLIEPGRALVAQSAVALYTVGAVKQSSSLCTYVSVDGGMGDNLRPALYGAKYAVQVANKANDAPQQHVAIAGRYCEQGDILCWLHVTSAPFRHGWWCFNSAIRHNRWRQGQSQSHFAAQRHSDDLGCQNRPDPGLRQLGRRREPVEPQLTGLARPGLPGSRPEPDPGGMGPILRQRAVSSDVRSVAGRQLTQRQTWACAGSGDDELGADRPIIVQ